MSTLERLTLAVKQAGLRGVGKPILQAIDRVGHVDVAAWQREAEAMGAVWPTEQAVLSPLIGIAESIFPPSGAAQPAGPTVSLTARGGQPAATPVVVDQPPATPPPTESGAAGKTAGVNPQLAAFSDAVLPPYKQLGEVRFDHLDGGQIALNWEPPLPADGVIAVYLVAGDMTELDRPSRDARLAAVQETTVTLTDVPRHVAVFAYLGASAEEAQAGPAKLCATGELVPDVANVEHDTRPRAIMLTWDNPARVTENHIYRSEPNQPLSRRHVGSEEVKAPRLTPRVRGGVLQQVSFVDDDLVPGATYEYRIHAVSRTDGRVRESRGYTIRLSTDEQLPPVETLVAEPVPGGVPRVKLSYAVPAAGDVDIIYSVNDPQSEDLFPGRKAGLEKLEILGTKVRDFAVEENGVGVIAAYELPEPDFSGVVKGPRWHCLTAVTVGKTDFRVGATAPVPMIASITKATLQDRVDWHLLRLRWPKGATFVEVVARNAQGMVIEESLIDPDTFGRVGGVMLRKLGGEPAGIGVRGVCLMGTQKFAGGMLKLRYDGHRLLRYAVQTDTRGPLGRNVEHELFVQLEGDWPESRQLLLAGASRCPLTEDRQLTPDLVEIGLADVPARMLVPGTATQVPFQPRQGAGERPPILRLLAVPSDAFDGRPMVSWREPPPAPARSLPPGRSGSVCPECFASLPVDRRIFECVGDCPLVDDPQRTKVLGQPNAKVRRTSERTAQPLPGGKGLGPLPMSTNCGCGRQTSQILCPNCHAKLPPGWPNTDLLTVSIVGTKGSGKSVYVWSLLPYLRDNLIKQLGGGMMPAANNEPARQMMDTIGQLTTTWEYPEGTAIMTPENGLRLPLLYNVSSVLAAGTDRLRALSFFDTAGEMLEDANLAMTASGILSNSDLIILMFDMRQIDVVRSALASGDLPSEVDPSAVYTHLVTSLRAEGQRYPRLAVVLNQFDLVHQAANVPGRVSTLLNRGDAVFHDPYALADERSQYYLPNDAALVDAECRQFLAGTGYGGFVHQVEGYPGGVQFFAISSVGGDPAGKQVPEDGISPFRVADPLRWAMYEAWGKR